MNVHILGGGISGLSAAYYVLKQHPEAKITLFEQSSRLGGCIDTAEVNGFVFDRGPRMFVAGRCPLLLAMSRDLGLEIVYSKPGVRYLLHEGKLRSLRSFWPTMLGAMGRHLLLPGKKSHDETMYDYGVRRFGRRATELLLDPFAKGVYGGDIRKLSAELCVFPRTKDNRLFSVKGLINALAQLPIDIRLNTQAPGLDGADLVISALPASEISRLAQIPLEIRYEPITVVNLGFHGHVLPHGGYGYLVPSSENELLLGMIWDTNMFPVAGQTKVTAMVRGAEPLAVAVDAMQRHLGVKQKPAAVLVKETSLPQYEVGHRARIEVFEQGLRDRWPKVRLVGNYLSGPSVESCLGRARVSCAEKVETGLEIGRLDRGR